METLDKINNLPLNPMLEAATGSLHQSRATMQRLQTTLDNINKITANQSMQQLPQDMQKTLRELNRSMQGFQPGSAAYNKMVADMQRLDQVLRELQPVLKTLNEKSNALVFEAKDKRILSLRGRNNEKWLIIAGALVLTACSSGSDNKSYYQLPLSAQSGAQSSTSQGSRLLWVEQVAVPDYPAGNGWSTRPAMCST